MSLFFGLTFSPGFAHFTKCEAVHDVRLELLGVLLQDPNPVRGDAPPKVFISFRGVVVVSLM